MPEGADLRYQCRPAATRRLDWTSPASTTRPGQRTPTGPTVLITEAGTGTPDYVEVENVSDQAIDTSGWYLVVNRGTGAGTNVNSFYYTKTCFPAILAPGEVAYWTDSTTEHYVGFSDIPFGTSGRGWAMIMDSQGNVVDFAAWVYSADRYRGHEHHGRRPQRSRFQALERRGRHGHGQSGRRYVGVPEGNLDHDDASDFVFQPPQVGDPAALNRGLQNPDLELPVMAAVCPASGSALSRPVSAAR